MAQWVDAATTLVVVLAYLLLVQCMMAAIVVLGQFVVLQVGKLWAMLPEPQEPKESEQLPYKLGGGLARWE